MKKPQSVEWYNKYNQWEGEWVQNSHGFEFKKYHDTSSSPPETSEEDLKTSLEASGEDDSTNQHESLAHVQEKSDDKVSESEDNNQSQNGSFRVNFSADKVPISEQNGENKNKISENVKLRQPEEIFVFSESEKIEGSQSE